MYRINIELIELEIFMLWLLYIRISKQIKILYSQKRRDQGLISFSRNVDKISFSNDPRQSMAFEKSRSSSFADYTGSNCQRFKLSEWLSLFTLRAKSSPREIFNYNACKYQLSFTARFWGSAFPRYHERSSDRLTPADYKSLRPFRGPN